MSVYGMKKGPTILEYQGRLYQIIPRQEEPLTVHYLPNYKGAIGTKRFDVTRLDTACGINVDQTVADGSIVKRASHFGTCAKDRSTLAACIETYFMERLRILPELSIAIYQRPCLLAMRQPSSSETRRTWIREVRVKKISKLERELRAQERNARADIRVFFQAAIKALNRSDYYSVISKAAFAVARAGEAQMLSELPHFLEQRGVKGG